MSLCVLWNMEFCNLLYAFPSSMFLQRRKKLCEIIKLEESPNPHLLPLTVTRYNFK